MQNYSHGYYHNNPVTLEIMLYIAMHDYSITVIQCNALVNVLTILFKCSGSDVVLNIKCSYHYISMELLNIWMFTSFPGYLFQSAGIIQEQSVHALC